MSVSCQKDNIVAVDLDPSNADIKITCDNETILEEYKDVEAKVINPNYIGGAENEQNLLGLFYLTIDKEDINNSYINGYKATDEILIPTNLPKELWVVGKKVVFSGRKKSCCGIHKGNIRVFTGFEGYGCKLEITQIKEKK